MIAAAMLLPDPTGPVARMRQWVPNASVVLSASAQLLRSALRSQFCQPTRTCAKDCGGKLRFTTSTSAVGNVAKVSEVVTPKLPPPPPRSAQNRSGLLAADAVTAWPPGSPAEPTDGQVPVGIPRPAAASASCIAYKLVAGVTVTCPLAAS